MTPICTVSFGPQLENVSEGRYPDGDTNAVYSMTNFTPRMSNALALPEPAEISSITRFADTTILTWTALPGRAYRVDSNEELDAGAWLPLSSAVRADGPVAEFIDTPAPARQRFYRIVLLQ